MNKPRTIHPVGYVRQQDLLMYLPVFECYSTEPEPQKGHRAVPLYTEDQVDYLIQDAIRNENLRQSKKSKTS